MESKVIAILCVAGLIVGATFYVLHTSAAYDLKNRLIDERNYVKGLSTTISTLEAGLQSLKIEKKRLEDEQQASKAKTTKKDALTAEVESTKKRTDEVSKSVTDLRQAFDDQVLLMRKMAEGTVTPELKLTSGRILKNVKIQRVNESIISIAHAEGVARLRKAEMPPEWVEKFQITDPPPAPPKDPNAAGASQPAALAQGPGSPPPDAAKIKELRSKIAKYEADIVLLRGNEAIWRQKASELRSKVTESEIKGRIVTSKGKIEEAQNTAAAFAKKIAEAEAQITLLRNELYAVNGGVGY